MRIVACISVLWLFAATPAHADAPDTTPDTTPSTTPVATLIPAPEESGALLHGTTELRQGDALCLLSMGRASRTQLGVMYLNNHLLLRNYAGDGGRLEALGAIEIEDIVIPRLELPLPERWSERRVIPPGVTVEPVPRRNRRREQQEVALGSWYYLHTGGDRGVDGLLRVLAFDPLERAVTLEWFTYVDGVSRSACPPDERLAHLESALREAEPPTPPPAMFMLEPRVVMQLRVPHIGGNRVESDMTGIAYFRTDHRSAVPLSMKTPTNEERDPTMYYEGGLIPEGKAFVVERITWEISEARDERRAKEVSLRIKDRLVFKKEDGDVLAEEGLWDLEEFILMPGDEDKVVLTVQYFRAASVVLEGRFEDAPATPQE